MDGSGVVGDWDRGSWMQTFTGRAFYPMAPVAEEVDIRDIAHSLSMQCRYNGHVHTFYSVAEHCVLMSWALEREHPTRPDLWLEGLLHDGTEAYVGDMVRPLKIHQPAFCEAEERVAIAIGERFGVRQSCDMSPEVKHADNAILLAERDALLGTPPAPWSVHVEPMAFEIYAWSPAIAEAQYIIRFDELMEARG